MRFVDIGMRCAFEPVNAHFSIDAKFLRCMLVGMDLQKIIASLEARAAILGIPMYKVCEAAGVAPSTYYRWKAGGSASSTKLVALSKTLTFMENNQ